MKNRKSTTGFTLVEALVSMAIIAFVIVTILSGFTHQKMATRKVAEKNIAIALADTRMQEMHKFSATQLTPGVTTDWIVHKKGVFKTYQSDPDDPNQYRRTMVIGPDGGDVLGTKMIIQVMVEYGRDRTTYPFKIVLTSKRGL